MKNLDVVEAFRALNLKKQAAVMEELQDGLSGDTPQGLHITARNGRELRRFTGVQDVHVLNWLQGFEPGEVFYDIGANVGGLTLTAAAMHRGHIRIVAIEPSFSSFESLARNLSRNGLLDSTIPLQVALLDRTGLAPMNYHSTAAGSAFHSVGDARNHMGELFVPVAVQMIPTYTLDDLIEILKLPPPTRLKIDVDGYEEPVLRGGSRTLAEGQIRDLLIEVVNHDGAGTRLTTVAAILSGHGYELVETFEHESAHGEGKSPVADYHFRSVNFQPRERIEAPLSGEAEQREARQMDEATDGMAAERPAAEAGMVDEVKVEVEPEMATQPLTKEAKVARKAEKAAQKNAVKQAAKMVRDAARAADTAEEAARRLAGSLETEETSRDIREIVQAAQRATRAARKAEESAARLTGMQIAKESQSPEGLAAMQAYEQVTRELAELRTSYYLDGAEKKIDVSELEGFSDVARLVIAEGRSYLGYDRLYTLWQAVLRAPHEHAVLEIGTYRGGSAKFVAETLRRAGRSPRFYVCDMFVAASKSPGASVEEVSAYLAEYKNVEVVPGDILVTGTRLAQEQTYAFIHIDVDFYHATEFCLKTFTPRLAPGAVIVVDDYGFRTCPGTKKAVDEFIAQNPGFRLLHLLTGQGVLFRVC